ncbi:hypothetical protein MSC49_10160 [Methylosinus sp. C49]|uniref:DUF3617 domain-containing protein n=1 Tax=Methylosinus sp. C49 TaxID=2699395 RepID=UPI0013679838|nr:DUF3617 family protein [Methylosinus sp. C49]BBU61081.1 hypothetical protein MSC49_10160 [Methylosinus sp. C49]
MNLHTACRATLIAAILPLAASASADSLPQRRPGFWRIKTISPEVGLQSHDVCIEAGDGLLGAPQDNCTKPTVESAQGGEVIVTFSCDLHGAREVTSLLFTGDFSSWYRAQSKTTLTQKSGATRERSGFTIDAKFLQPECPKP